MAGLEQQTPGVVRIEEWAAFPWLHAGFSTRQGGGSSVYGEGELNLGWTPEDNPETVADNRRRFASAVTGDRSLELVTIRQIHGNVVCAVEADHGPLATEEGKAILQGDGLITDLKDVLLGIQTADCTPVLVADTQARVVAAFHAGWRGTLARIVEQGIAAMKLRYGSRSSDLIAAIGPAIGPCCFEVGPEVRSAFESEFAYAPELFSEVGSQIHLDLFEANRRQLLDAGVATGKISLVGECTACTRLSDGRRKYFSHRSEHGVTGRMLNVIGVI
jgi:YfiH family protein